MIPSLATLSAPFRAARKSVPKSQKKATSSQPSAEPRVAAQTTQEPAVSTETRQHRLHHTDVFKGDAKAVFADAFNLLASHPRYKPSAEVLRRDYTVQSIIAQGPSANVKSHVHQCLHTAGSRSAHRLDAAKSSRQPSLAFSRHFSTTSPLGPLTFRSNPSMKHSQTRSASTSQSSQSLLAHLEQTANNNPQSASSQNGFYSALLRANMPDILVERYETGRYATNPACDAMYYRALERLGQGSTVGASPSAQPALSQDTRNAVSRAVVAAQRGGSTAGARPGQSGTGARTSPLHVVVDESRASYLFKVVKFLLIYGAVGYFALILISFAFEASGIFRRVGGPQNAEVKPEAQTTRFSDVKGCDEAIEELQEIVDFLKHPEKFNQLGGKLPKGVLMVGPPGTGKTLLARAVAGEAGVPFFYMSGSEFDEVYVGVGAKRVRELFTNAKAKAPAIVFIDELDAVGGKRNERDAAYHMQTLNQMLTELDGFDQTSGVVFIGATNFPQMLDKALTRPGRFDRQVVVPLPDVRGRMAILKYHMRNMQLGVDIDPGVIARGTSGFSGADLENLVNQAAVHASKNNASKIGMMDLDWARDRIMMGAQKKHMVIQDKDKLMTAYHEAGHALMGHFNSASMPLYKVTILPRGQTLGVTHFMPDLDKVSQSKREMMASIDVSMGGKVAEELIYGEDEVTSGCSSDLANATRVAYAMVTQYGMGETLGSIAFDDRTYDSLSPETKHKVEAEVRRILDESQERARKLLASKRKELELVARGLVKHETLTKDEMAKIIMGETLPDKPVTLPGMPIKLPELPLPPAFTGSTGEGSGGGDSPQLPGASGAQG